MSHISVTFKTVRINDDRLHIHVQHKGTHNHSHQNQILNLF